MCGVCGAAVRPPFVAPPPELAPDLDLRPGEPTRSTPAALDADLPRLRRLRPRPRRARRPGARETMLHAGYQALRGPAAENAFLRHAALAEAAGDVTAAAGSVLQAAWLLDDANRDATALRRRAAALMDRAALGQDALRLVDVWRRADEPDRARARAEALLAAPELTETDAALLRYQLGLVAAGDNRPPSDVQRAASPAQRPHVTHGRVPERSLWQRLIGR